VAGVGSSEDVEHGLTLTVTADARGEAFWLLGRDSATLVRLRACSCGPPKTINHTISGVHPWLPTATSAARDRAFGHSISHSHRRTKRRWNPNIQRVKALVGDAGVTPKRLNVCTSCLKAGKVKR
jgi:large subunit ribosomal protein L28